MTVNVVAPKTKLGDPTWEMALLFPRQGEWTEDDYFALVDGDNRLIELDDGRLEILPMPSLTHQDVLIYLFDALRDYLRSIKDKGKASLAPVSVRLWPGTLREPDLFYLSESRLKQTREYPDGVDLAVEVVSGSPRDRKRDLVTKRKQYAKAGISEYWIVDLKRTTVTVLTLNTPGSPYKVYGTFKPGEQATSKYFPGFTVDVTKLFTHASRS